ncbi:MAG: aminotransferase class V-fold PLP-dependent enzyme [Lachnospiraceae bacterium]|nr:aminotransferase class V-fold PLP-dependent enzyme [Lachnospiraceae bacterium]MDY5741909.1 aminotransferase class V-fold PLP-dependent enzyme [Lachnospiraceae bacterium]
MNTVYLDNASTSFPKPACVADRMYQFMTNEAVNISRGTYRSAYRLEEALYDTRVQLASFFDHPRPQDVVFSAGITHSLNLVMKGLLKQGDHVLISSMEHNAVTRPLTQLSAKGITFDRIPCNTMGELDLTALPGLIHPQTRAIIMLHASNVCGTMMPIREVGALCRRHGLFFILDSAQTAGLIPISMTTDCIDALCFTGHKALLGPQGIGGCILTPAIAAEIDPLISGGTGSFSHLETIPELMPDRFEAGTLNLPGIIGLQAALSYINQIGQTAIFEHELSLTAALLQAIPDIPNLRLLGRPDTAGRVGVVSVTPTKADPAMVAARLEEEFGIQTRVGLHCAPGAHKTLGSYPQGSIRFSFGYQNTPADVTLAVSALTTILKG